jgi:hypothetical protein
MFQISGNNANVRSTHGVARGPAAHAHLCWDIRREPRNCARPPEQRKRGTIRQRAYALETRSVRNAETDTHVLKLSVLRDGPDVVWLESSQNINAHVTMTNKHAIEQHFHPFPFPWFYIAMQLLGSSFSVSCSCAARCDALASRVKPLRATWGAGERGKAAPDAHENIPRSPAA